MAGFSAILIAFGASGRKVSPMQADRLFAIVSLSLIAALMTVVPALAQALGVPAPYVFRVSGGLLIPIAWPALFTQMLFRKRVSNTKGLVPWTLYLAYSTVGIMLSATVLCIADIPEGRSTGMYLLALVCILTVAGLRFMAFIVEVYAESLRDSG